MEYNNLNTVKKKWQDGKTTWEFFKTVPPQSGIIYFFFVCNSNLSYEFL